MLIQSMRHHCDRLRRFVIILDTFESGHRLTFWTQFCNI